MDDIIKETSVKMLELLKKALQKGNLSEAAFIGTRLTEISVTLDSKVGVFTGETVESSLLQLHGEMIRYDVGKEEHAKEMDGLVLLVDTLIGSIRSGVEENIYSALLELRFYATKKQYGMPGEYRRRRPPTRLR